MMDTKNKTAIFDCFLLSTLILFGCAKATITPDERPSTLVRTAQRPDRIVVYDFTVSAENVTENQGPIQRALRAAKGQDEQEQERLTTGQDAAHELSQALVKELHSLGFNAENLPRETPASGNVMIIDGQLLSANEGNRARRLIIGFGAGASSLETQVNVSQVSGGGAPVQLMSFKTHADSGKMPGAALTMGAGGAAQGAAAAGAASAAQGVAKTYGSMLSTLADKSAKQIAAYVSQYFATKGWISGSQAHKASITE
jgi:hypothetical protein